MGQSCTRRNINRRGLPDESRGKHDMVKKFNSSIKPNYQLCTLADGITKMECIGEIDETFFINQFKIRFHAVVAEKLHCSFVAGNNYFYPPSKHLLSFHR